jgi:hypothetical protein
MSDDTGKFTFSDGEIDAVEDDGWAVGGGVYFGDSIECEEGCGRGGVVGVWLR